MMKCKIISLGSLKENFFKEASKEYQKRLTRFCDLEIIELDAVKLSDNPSESEIKSALKKESELIIKKIPQNSKVISLCIEGKQLSSEKFAKEIENASSFGQNLCFIIGSSYGLSDEIKQKSDLRLSISEMTFPHKLFRIMLLEQLYRGFMINSGAQYHK